MRSLHGLGVEQDNITLILTQKERYQLNSDLDKNEMLQLLVLTTKTRAPSLVTPEYNKLRKNKFML